jgi:hypothetical protein
MAVPALVDAECGDACNAEICSFPRVDDSENTLNMGDVKVDGRNSLIICGLV